MSAHTAREARRARMTEEAKERALTLTVGAALLLSRDNGGDPRTVEGRREAIEAVSRLMDEAEVFCQHEGKP